MRLVRAADGYKAPARSEAEACRPKDFEISANNDQSREDRPNPSPLRYASLGLELAAAIVGLTLVGLWFDHHFGTGPVGVLVGAGLGVVGGLYNFIRAALKMNQDGPARRGGQDEFDRRDNR